MGPRVCWDETFIQYSKLALPLRADAATAVYPFCTKKDSDCQWGTRAGVYAPVDVREPSEAKETKEEVLEIMEPVAVPLEDLRSKYASLTEEAKAEKGLARVLLGCPLDLNFKVTERESPIDGNTFLRIDGVVLNHWRRASGLLLEQYSLLLWCTAKLENRMVGCWSRTPQLKLSRKQLDAFNFTSQELDAMSRFVGGDDEGAFWAWPESSDDLNSENVDSQIEGRARRLTVMVTRPMKPLSSGESSRLRSPSCTAEVLPSASASASAVHTPVVSLASAPPTSMIADEEA